MESLLLLFGQRYAGRVAFSVRFDVLMSCCSLPFFLMPIFFFSDAHLVYS